MPLTSLRCFNTRVADLSPLQGMSLTQFIYDVRLFQQADETLLKSLPLKKIQNMPVAEFWKQLAARRKGAVDFAESTAQLSADKQIEAVRARLDELAPKWKGTLTAKVTDLVVTEVSLSIQPEDLTPLMA